MSSAETVVLGVVSGILTSAAIYLLALIVNRILLPWYRNFVYRDVEIQGSWKEEFDFGNGNTQFTTAELVQKAHTISGRITVVQATDGETTKTETMALIGTVKDRLFSATLTPVSKRRVGIATVLLEVIGDGSRMRGNSSWYDSGSARIASKASQWERL